MKLRNTLIAVHGWIGIVMGLLLVIVSLTGTAIVFQAELDQTLNRSLWQVTPQSQHVSLDAPIQSIQAAHPEFPLWFIQAPQTPDQSYVINQKMPNEHRLQTFVNPYTGEILGERIWEQSLVGFLYALHHDLFAGKIGQIIVGITGVSLLLMAITGILLWTGWRRLSTGFKVRWGATPALLNYDLHNVGGFISHVFLAILAFTGVVIVIIHFLPMFNQAPAFKPSPQKPPVALSELLQKADAAIPEGTISFIEFPEHDPEKLMVRQKLPDQETGRFDLSTVELNRYSGEVLQVTRVAKAEGLFKFIVPIATLHFGTFGGLPTRILYLLVGLMPTVLLITGLVNWRRRRLSSDRREITRKLAQETQTSSPTKL
jgi:uncharacterized iron-regulated membrane protein